MEEKYTPTLTLDPISPKSEESAEAPSSPMMTNQQIIEKMEENTRLSPEEQQLVSDFASKIDITDSVQIMNYGAQSQVKLSEFSDNALNNVKTKDLGETGNMITELIGELENFNTTDDKGLFGFLRKKINQLENLRIRYDKAENNVNRIVLQLEDHQRELSKDISTLDNMYEMNLVYFKELSMYILAGKKKLDMERNTTLPELTRKAEESGLPEDAQKARDFADMCTRFEKKIYDLELTRNISLQMAPQIRLIQNNDAMMVEKIQTTLMNTIPLWKNQMVISLGLAHTQQAIDAQRAVTDMTNRLLKQNADALHTATISAAEESERGIVDIETLTETNRKLIETMDDVLRIQREGHEKRQQAETELARIEEELRNKLLEVTK